MEKDEGEREESARKRHRKDCGMEELVNYTRCRTGFPYLLVSVIFLSNCLFLRGTEQLTVLDI